MDIIVTVVLALMVLFGAALMGKMLKDMYPGTLFGQSRQKGTDDTSSEV